MADPVLDVGCRTGELAIYLARRGFDVLGVDVSVRAIEQAKAKARWRRVDAHFLVWNALDLRRLAAAGFSFRTVVDSGMFHVLGDAERDRLVDGLGAVVPPGGRYVVLGDERRDPRSAYGLTPAECRERFVERGGWELEFAYETVFERRWDRNPAYLVRLRRV